MKVRATERGFYGSLREPGEVFDIPGMNGFSELWMEKVTRRRPAREPEPEPEPEPDAD